nr:hypothetical protein [Tanacetum cinerariifolium]
MPVGDEVTGHLCSKMAAKYAKAYPRQIPPKIQSIIGEKHIFQIHFISSTKNESGDFTVESILDKTATTERSTSSKRHTPAQLDCAAKSVSNGHGEYRRAPNVNPEGLLNFAGISLLASKDDYRYRFVTSANLNIFISKFAVIHGFAVSRRSSSPTRHLRRAMPSSWPCTYDTSLAAHRVNPSLHTPVMSIDHFFGESRLTPSVCLHLVVSNLWNRHHRLTPSPPHGGSASLLHHR